MSWFWATLDLTNPGEVNNSLFTHFTSISVKGRLYNKISGENKSGINVAIEVNDAVDMSYTDITDVNGQFDINYIIDGFLDIYTSHKIEVVVTDTEPGGPGSEIEYPHFYTIYINATSFFDLDLMSSDDPSVAKLTEEIFTVVGSLKYDNGQGIPFVSVNYYWLDGATIVSQGSFLTDISGSLISLQVPITLLSYLTLKFNYSNPPFVEYSEGLIPNIKVFSDVNFGLNIDYVTTEGDTYVLTGTISSSTDPSIKVGNRDLDVIFNGTNVASATTNAVGYFSSSFLVPSPNGTASIQVNLDNSAARTIISSVQFITVENRPPSTQRPVEMPPFLIFSVIFFPILIGIIVGLAVYGFFFYKKQEEESRVVAIPLESKILNLKILKESGRLEESLSYLFNAIYMDLINAKYNRVRKDNETIRDFAIISVKELKLTPASIYPFIQQVEQIIYGKPYKITEEDFYKTCELFSPIYFQLTMHNFVLNF
ncbi:MAG: hypothetical protein ACXAC5_16610 [Promethearchaeota archaeon]